MATEANKQELVTKVTALVESKFDRDLRKAFDHYDSAFARDGKIGSEELTKLLEDADIGNVVTRGRWVQGIIEELDTDKDGQIAWGEFEFAVKR